MFTNIVKNRNAFLMAMNSLNQTFFRGLNYIPIEAQTQISVGHKMTQTIDKNRQKALINEMKRKQFNPKNRNSDHLLISCSTPSFNHYNGQVYKKFTTLNLASVGWLARQSSGKYFTINALGNHPSLTDESCSFTLLNLNQSLIDSLKKLKIERPTHIQYLASNEILNRNSHGLIVAETGGGKTLAFLLPVIETCTRMHKIIHESGLTRSNNQPLAVIIVPTRELVFQIYTTLLKLFGSNSSIKFVCDLHPDVISAKRNLSSIPIASMDDKDQNSPVDILITIPSSLLKRLKSSDDTTLNSLYLKNIVCDEADTLMDDSNNEILLECLKLLRLNLDLPKSKITNDEEVESVEEKADFRAAFERDLESRLKDPSTHLSFVSATTPRDMRNILENLIDYDKNSFQVLKTKNTSKLMLHVPQKFMRFSTSKRNTHLLELVDKELKNKKQQRTIMIFSHRSSNAMFVSKFLKENGIDCELLTKKINTNERESLVERFFNGQVRVICCTDLASRGWDTLHVNHVINFEMPLFITDYIHRIGRVGRLNCHKSGGGSGMVTSYVTKPYEVDLVWNIERSVRLNIDLHNVNANVKRVYNTKYEPKIGHAKAHNRNFPKTTTDPENIQLKIDDLGLQKLETDDGYKNWAQQRET